MISYKCHWNRVKKKIGTCTWVIRLLRRTKKREKDARWMQFKRFPRIPHSPLELFFFSSKARLISDGCTVKMGPFLEFHRLWGVIAPTIYSTGRVANEVKAGSFCDRKYAFGSYISYIKRTAFWEAKANIVLTYYLEMIAEKKSFAKALGIIIVQ